MSKTLRILRLSSQGGQEQLVENMASLRRAGFSVLFDEPVGSALAWPYTAGSAAERLAALNAALREPQSSVLLCARGGYGASDLLPLLDWVELARLGHKWLVGFSDVTALATAFWAKLGWPSIHGPMPASPLWGQQGGHDVTALLALLRSEKKEGAFKLEPLSEAGLAPNQGLALGGCFSVFTNLLGTPFFPSLKGAILFFEDTNENPGRILRYFNQLVQSGALAEAAGIVWGRFRELGVLVSEAELKKELATRAPLPMWSCEAFGHCAPNFPFVLGSKVAVQAGGTSLVWQQAF